MTKTYAGVGSRKTPEEYCNMFTNFAELAEQLGWTLRSGAADGADSAFERGVKHHIHKEIFLPWGAFNGSRSGYTHPSADAMAMAPKFVPHWMNLSEGAKKLHARNVHQVLGSHLNDPVKFLICWTDKGEYVGGTATALRVAATYHIPIFNLGGYCDEQALEAILKG